MYSRYRVHNIYPQSIHTVVTLNIWVIVLREYPYRRPTNSVTLTLISDKAKFERITTKSNTCTEPESDRSRVPS